MRVGILIGIKIRNMIINWGWVIDYTRSNMGVVDFGILLWLIIWLDLFELEVQQMEKTQVLEYILVGFRQVDF